jgi:hypothetical protein
MVVRRREMNDRLRTELDKALRNIIQRYATSFAQKEYEEENNEHDVIMDIFGISPTLKRENRQCRFACPQFGPALRFGGDEPCDFCVAKRAIDTKYRIGSGDAGTLKKFKSYGALLRSKGYTPITLIVRTDNLGAAMTALTAGNWEVYTGTDTFNYVNSLTGFDLMAWLEEIKREGRFRITR